MSDGCGGVGLKPDLLDFARLADQHDRNAVADREGEVGGLGDQFLAS
jgi:hypothetical protein